LSGVPDIDLSPVGYSGAEGDPSIGAFVEGQPILCSGEQVPVVNPSTGRLLMRIAAGCEQDTSRAVVSARAAFEDGRWNGAPLSERKRALSALADLIEREAAVLDRLDAEEMGKPVSEKFGSAVGAAGIARFCSESIDKVLGDVYLSDQSSFVSQRRVPRGVVGAIIPWNFPTYNVLVKAAPALAAGNSVVLKPSELSSRSALVVARLAIQAGIPPGAFNVVPGLGASVGRALALHEDVDMIAFTGSTDVGRSMLQYSGQSNMKVVLAECGGKSPHVVFNDGIDLDFVADAVARALLLNQGQICSLGSRVIISRSIQEEFAEKVASRLEHRTMGNALDWNTTFGPQASQKQCSRVMALIKGACDDRFTLICGGRRALEESGGYFVEPTIFTEVDPSSQIAQTEVFGPVLALIPFDDEGEAVRIANGTRYGLAAYVWTSNLARGMRVSRLIRSSVWVNSGATPGEGAGHAGSYEPTRQSGVGVEGGLAGVESYLRRQFTSFTFP
jgi:acyl-CoA reductase-like NAD-dependent aldehyde dehydrogenase